MNIIHSCIFDQSTHCVCAILTFNTTNLDVLFCVSSISIRGVISREEDGAPCGSSTNSKVPFWKRNQIVWFLTVSKPASGEIITF